MNDTASPTRDIVVVGAGMAAHRFVSCLLRDPGAAVRVTVIGDEGNGPYDRSALAGVLSTTDAAELSLDRAVFRDDRVRLIRDDRVLRIDRARRTVRTRARRTYSYDTLVLATGSFAARVAVEGATLPGCFVFRTVEDAEDVRAFVDSRSQALGRPLRGAVIGGGPRGLEVAVALRSAGVEATVVQYPDRLMSEHLDRTAAGIVQTALEGRGITVRTRTRTTRLDPDESGAVTALEFQDGTFERADLVVFTVGVRPRDELARNAGLEVDPRGGVIVDDRCETSDADILAIGEVARAEGRRVDTVAAVQAMAEAAAARVGGGEGRFVAPSDSAHHTVAGVDVACFGDAVARGTGAVEVVIHEDRGAGVYRKLVLTDDARTVLGGVLVGDAGSHGSLGALVGASPTRGLAAQLWIAGSAAEDPSAVCGHIALSHRDLLSAVQSAGVRSFSEVGTRFGRDLRCERCTLALARVLSELAGGRRPLEGRGMPDDVDGDLRRGGAEGALVVVPIVHHEGFTPAHLIAIGQIAALFALQPRIVGARIELRGARSEQCESLREHRAAAGLAAVGGFAAELGISEGAERRGVRGSGSAVAPYAAEQSRSGGFATRWGERAPKGRVLRGSPLRAENPA